MKTPFRKTLPTLATLALAATLAACGSSGDGSSDSGGSGGGGGSSTANTGTSKVAGVPDNVNYAATTTLDAHRLAQQASFGPTEALTAKIALEGRAAWVTEQMQYDKANATLAASALSSYTSGGKDPNVTGSTDNCGTWDTWNCSGTAWPLVADFGANAINNSDQLRQRVAFAFSQLLVLSDQKVQSTYGLRNYHNMLLADALGNFKTLLKDVSLSPAMGYYLDNANNDGAAPNENYARELLQLFSLGLCKLNPDGTEALTSAGKCDPTYGNADVREYAYALSGWTYPGSASPTTWNAQNYTGQMVAVDALHNESGLAHTLLAGVTVPAGATASASLDLVLDSIMAHQNVAPFVATHLIHQLVKSNPSTDYVKRVVAAFQSGSYASGGKTFGTGTQGDLKATVAAVLLDAEASSTTVARGDGKLMEPALVLTSLARALNVTKTAADANGNATGLDAMFSSADMACVQNYCAPTSMDQVPFDSPSVFNFYPASYAIPAAKTVPTVTTKLLGPSFGILTGVTAINRMNLVDCATLGSDKSAICSENSLGDFNADLSSFITQYEADGAPATLGDAPATTQADQNLVDRLATLATGAPLADADRSAILTALLVPGSTAEQRVRQAAYLVFASPAFHVQP